MVTAIMQINHGFKILIKQKKIMVTAIMQINHGFTILIKQKNHGYCNYAN